MKNKKAQMQLSFGMIFSIILIIIFLGFAIYGIFKFLEIADAAKLGKFKSDLQTDIDNAWKSQISSEDKTYNLPGKITYVCLMDGNKMAKGKDGRFYDELSFNFFGDENLFFYPSKEAQALASFEIQHINITKTTEENNPYCIRNSDGVRLIIEKKYGEKLPYIK